MKSKLIFITVLVLLMSAKIYGQEIYQTFSIAGFNVKCNCKLYENKTFISMAKQQGVVDILAAYVCSENEENPENGVVNNINIYDESKSYKKIQPTEYAMFEKSYLEQYATNLKNASFRYMFTNFQGVPAIEYTFDQEGLPTKAIFFLKNKKSYLLQVGTRMDLQLKYNSLKSSFHIL